MTTQTAPRPAATEARPGAEAPDTAIDRMLAGRPGEKAAASVRLDLTSEFGALSIRVIELVGFVRLAGLACEDLLSQEDKRYVDDTYRRFMLRERQVQTLLFVTSQLEEIGDRVWEARDALEDFLAEQDVRVPETRKVEGRP